LLAKPLSVSLDQQTAEIPGLLSKPTSLLLEEFGAGNASPGSGSASALMGLLAIKLLMTVCRKSLLKPKLQDKKPRFEFILEQLSIIEPRLQSLFQKDAEEFDEVVRLRLKRDSATTAAEKARLTNQANALLEVATENAFAITELSLQLIDLGIIAFREGWAHVRGDSGSAISVSVSGAMSGIFIVNLNLKTLSTRIYAREQMNRCNNFMESLRRKQSRVFTCVAEINAEATQAIQTDLQLTLEF
jgi:methenyltetrahydrofolate cyclohydrolase